MAELHYSTDAVMRVEDESSGQSSDDERDDASLEADTAPQDLQQSSDARQPSQSEGAKRKRRTQIERIAEGETSHSESDPLASPTLQHFKFHCIHTICSHLEQLDEVMTRS